MGSRLGRRVIHFANLPMKLLLPSPPLDSVREFALKTIPSASKIEIRRVLESLYGFDVEEVRTLNREGKKRKVAGYLAAKPDYKKAYVTLRYPLSVSPDLFPIPWIQEAIEKKQLSGKKKSKPKAVVEDDGDEEADKGKLASSKHWLHKDDDDLESRREPRGGHHQYRRDSYQQRNRGGGSGGRKNKTAEKKEEGKFPWSSMPSWK